MQPQELKTLVESGVYKPDPAQIATAMLQPPRRPRAAHRDPRYGRASWSKPRRLEQLAPGQPDLDPLAGGTSPIGVSAVSAAAPSRADASLSRSGGSAASSS